MNRKPQGVISYAGLDVTALLAGARLMFANQPGEDGCRLSSLMPLFPEELILSMPFAGVAQPGQPVAPGGFSIDPAEYHCRLRAQLPKLYTGDNLARNLDAEGVFHGRGVVTVDEAWTTLFPQYQPYAGERLTIYPLGGGAQCAAVPESLYPKAAGLLRDAETALGITHRCHDYARYVYRCIRAGEAFDADLFETRYLNDNRLAPVALPQKELGRLMQDQSMLRSVREGEEAGGLYTEDAKRAEHIRQYVPGLYACDVFDELPHTRRTARLLQPVWEDGFVSDWWICAQDAAACLLPDKQALDMAALCRGFQLAPVYDPATRGGSYAARVRVVTVKDKELRLRAADTLNNPAYGSGMSPLGTINRLVYLPGSREWLRQGRLEEEEPFYRCENTAVSPEEYRQMTLMALLQERKGRLVDALYRRESVLGGVNEISPDYAQLRELMNRPAEELEAALRELEKTQLSGYDADLDYLRRMGMEREWKPLPNQRKTFRFAPDALRQASIESGFAMRGACLRCTWEELALPPADGSEAQALPDSENAPFPGSPVQPLWLNAADPRCLAGEAAEAYAAQHAAPAESTPDGKTGASPTGSPEAAEAAVGAKPAKPKKGGKKKSAKKTKAQKSAGSMPFSEEELERRQVPMQLPEPLPGEVGMGQQTPEAPAGDAAPKAAPKKPAPGGEQPPQNGGEQPDPSLEQLKNGQLSFRFDDLS